jgi:hypothetical protein
VGDKITCPRHGDGTITSGDPSMLVDGKPVARHGDKTSCGATLIATQQNTVEGISYELAAQYRRYRRRLRRQLGRRHLVLARDQPHAGDQRTGVVLLVLPLLLLLIGWAARHGRAPARRRRRPARPAPHQRRCRAGRPPLPAALSIAASAIRVPHGASVDELRAAGGNQARLTSTGTAGRRRLSVMSARLRDIDERTAPRPGSLARQLQLANPHFDTAQWRALAATSAVSELAAQAASHENVAPWLQQEHERQQHRLPPNAVPVPRRHPAVAGRVACGVDRATARDRRSMAAHCRRAGGWPQQRLAAAPEALHRADAAQALSDLLGHCGDASTLARPS